MRKLKYPLLLAVLSSLLLCLPAHARNLPGSGPDGPASDTTLVRQELVALNTPDGGVARPVEMLLTDMLARHSYLVENKAEDASGAVVVQTQSREVSRRIHLRNKVKLTCTFILQSDNKLVLSAYAVERGQDGRWKRLSELAQSHLDVHLTNLLKELQTELEENALVQPDEAVANEQNK